MAKSQSNKEQTKKIVQRIAQGKLKIDAKTAQVTPVKPPKRKVLRALAEKERLEKERLEQELLARELAAQEGDSSPAKSTIDTESTAETKPIIDTETTVEAKSTIDAEVAELLGEVPPQVLAEEPKVVAAKEIEPKIVERKSARPKVAKSEVTELKIAAPEIAVAAAEVADDSPKFADLGLSEPLTRAITEMGYESPTPIQARAIPVLLAGHDLIGQAQTGTGKTAAFALPLIESLDPKNPRTQALILAPTRELAVQVAGGIYDLAKHTGLRVVPIYGGQPIDRQFRALRNGAQIVVGTPGRVQDHLRRDSLSLENVKFCVLDEADEMLALGFYEEIEAILAQLPEERQTAFFSATMPSRILALTKKFLKNPQHISIESKKRTVDNTQQAYYEVSRGQKLHALARILDMETPGPAMVFCRTRQETNDLSEALRLRGYNAEALHGDMSQSERERVLKRFREEQCDLLVATDVAARGLDIEGVTHVINYDIPWDVEQYIHRIGRTGRAGRSGDAITLVEGRERRQLQLIEKMIGTRIKPMRLPTAADVAARRRQVFAQTLRDVLESGDFEAQLATVDELGQDHDLSEIAAAALTMLWKSQHNASAEAAQEMAADGEQPEAGMTRLFVGLGRNDNLRPGDLVGAITNEAGLSGRDIGTIDIMDRSSFVEVPTHAVENILRVLKNTKLRGKKINLQVARPKGS